jgi:putative transposase
MSQVFNLPFHNSFESTTHEYEFRQIFILFIMSRAYKIKDQDKLYFITFATVNWIDFFTRKDYKDIIVESLKYCIENKGLELYAWCIMSNHVHLIIGTHGNKMEDILRDLKRHTSKTILKAISEHTGESRKEWMLWMFERAGKYNPNNEKYQFWQQHNKPIALYTRAVTRQKLDYLHHNPVAAGIVVEPWDYLHSSARDYFGGRGLIKISFIE